MRKKILCLLILFSLDFCAFSQWDEVPISFTSVLYAVDIDNSGVCYAGGSKLYKSINFGISWNEVFFTGVNGSYYDFVTFNSVKIVNANEIYAAGRQYSPNYPVILKTNDNGVNWSHTILSNNIGEILGIDFVDNLNGIAVGSDGYFYWTNDGGTNWNPESVLASGFVYNDVVYSSSNLIIAVGSFNGNGVISQSINGGQTWTTNLISNRNFVSIDYNSMLSLYTVVSSENGENYLYKSSDNGNTWTEDTLLEFGIRCHSLLNSDTLFFGGDDGLITKFQNNYFEYSNLHMNTITDIEFNQGIGLAVSLYDNSIYRYDTSSPGSVIQIVDFELLGSYCIGNQIVLTPSNDILDSYEWLINGVSISNNYQLNYTFSNNDVGSLEIQLITNYNGNIDTITHYTSVASDLTISDFTTTLDTVVCESPYNQYFWVYGFANGTNYILLKDGIEITPNLVQGFNVRYLLAGYTNNFEIEMIKWTTNDCDSISISKTFTVDVDTYSDFNQTFYSLDSLVCVNDSSEIIIPLSDSLYTYELYENGIFIYSTIANNDTLYLPTGIISANSSYSLTTISPNGCLRNLNTIDSIYVDIISADFNIGSGYFLLDSLIQIDTSNVFGESYNWSVEGDPSILNDTLLINPIIAFDSIGEFEISLIVNGEVNGCIDQQVDTIHVYNEAPDSMSSILCWLKEIDSPIILEKAVDIEGNIIHVGYVKEQASWTTVNYAVIQKYNSNGDLLWEYQHPYLGVNNHNSSIFGSVTTDNYGNIYITGCADAKKFHYQGFSYEINSSSPVYTFLIKLSPNGDFLWWNVSNDYTLVGGFADVIVVDDLLLASINNCSSVITFQNQIISDPNSSMRGVRIVKMDLDGNYIEEYYASSNSSSQNTSCSSVIPLSSHPNRRAIVGPELFMGSDSLLYVSGEIKENITFGNITHSSSLCRFGYIAKLDIYDNYTVDWVASVKTSTLNSNVYLNCSSINPILKSTMDNNNNIIQSITWSETQNAPFNEYKTYSSISKFDSDLNLNWIRQLNTGFQNSSVNLGEISDIFCSGNNIYFVGKKSSELAIESSNISEFLIPKTYRGNLFIGAFDSDGELKWVEDLGQFANEYPDVLGGTSCGDVYVSGKCMQYYSLLDSTFNFELGGNNYGSITGGFMFKLADSICVSGGCYTLCQDSTLFPIPIINYDTQYVSTNTYNSYQWFYNGDTIPGATDQTYLYTENGEYTVSVIDLAGCSGSNSLYETCLNIDFFNDTIIYFNDNILGTGLFSSYQWYLNGNSIQGAVNQTYAYSQNGNYSVIVTDSNECSKELILDEMCLNQNYFTEPIILDDNGILNVNNYDNYQWIYNGDSIIGAIDQYYDYTDYGYYSVSVIDSNSCVGISDSIQITGLGITNYYSSSDYSIYPNPTSGSYILTLNEHNNDIEFDLISVNGASCYSNVQIKNNKNGVYMFDISQLENGVYFLRFNNNYKSYSIRVVKID